MKLAVGADERLALVDHVIERLEKEGHNVQVFAPTVGQTSPWPGVAVDVAERVARRECDYGVLFCWTGTGVSMAANKVAGVRAALCTDAQTAAGARKWNDANIVVMSLRSTSNTVADEILDAWFATGPDPEEAERIREMADLDARFRRPLE